MGEKTRWSISPAALVTADAQEASGTPAAVSLLMPPKKPRAIDVEGVACTVGASGIINVGVNPGCRNSLHCQGEAWCR